MKAGTENKLKFKQLKSRLGLREWQCGGLLDALWRFTRMNAPDGDLSRFTPEEIAVGIDWSDSPEQLLSALVNCRWLDAVEGRLLVHDWWEHAEDSVHRQLAKAGILFACGRVPKLHKLEQKDRAKAEAHFAELPASAPRPPRVRPAPTPASALRNVTEADTDTVAITNAITNAVAVPLPLPLPLPLPAGADDGGGAVGDGFLISISEAEWPEIRDECNRVLKVVPIGQGGRPREDCELILKSVVLKKQQQIPESVFAGALDHVKRKRSKTSVEKPAALYRAALKTRCTDQKLDLPGLLGRVRIPPWLDERIKDLSRAIPTAAGACA